MQPSLPFLAARMPTGLLAAVPFGGPKIAVKWLAGCLSWQKVLAAILCGGLEGAVK
jgi:hypothetical protein